MEKENPRQMIKWRILKLINQNGLPIATLVYWQIQANQHSSDSSQS